ncbi:MAG: cardiolipin synthase [Clostridiales bacterium]|nr:cardiolipin synthase [Clostridiales bacterium]
MRKIRGLWRIVFGRTTILVVLLLIQAFILFGGFYLLDNKMWAVNFIVGVAAVIILMYILNINQNANFKVMWIIFILVMPVMGVAFFIFTRIQPGTKFIANRVEELLKEEASYLRPETDVMNRIYAESKQDYGLFKYMYEQGHYPVYDNASVRYFPLGEDKYEEMLYRLEQAKEYIFMEYFIVDKGDMWDSILKILARKVKEGVEVRFMYDGTCTLSLLPTNYPKRLKKLGIKCKVFSPMRPLLSTHQNNRDHRKVLVIDGYTAFTGGINIADEYINKRERFGHWKDTAIMVRGCGVNSFTLMFLQMWNIKETVKENYERYLRYEAPADPAIRNGGYIVPYGDSPLDDEEIGEKVYRDILNRAKDYVHIMTPYLILDDEMLSALIFAAERGVDVKLILPHIPDKKYAYLLARTHYADLVSHGVKIYEYTPGFVHAKVFVSDDEKAVVGTINLDFRSLYLHFECAAYIWKNPVIRDIEADYQNTLANSQQMTMKEIKKYGIVPTILGRCLRLIAPLM